MTHHDTAAELRRSGMTATAARRAVLAVLDGRAQALSAGDIHTLLRDQGNRIGLTTVYRTLHALAAVDLVHVFHLDGQDSYRHCRYGRHHHLVCRRCRTVIERSGDELESVLDRIRVDEDFLPDPRQADVVGVCRNCRDAVNDSWRTP
jgi:Fur family ferric uptake transcriptional regulator